ncbi:MAG: hypothetical protein WDO69_03110 [Pseudomonadota bacterium]
MRSKSTTTLGSFPLALATAALAAIVLSAACGGDATPGGAAGAGSLPPPSGAGANGIAGAPSAVGGAGGSAPGVGGAPASFAGAAGGVVASSGAGGVLAASGSGGAAVTIPPPTNSDHCLNGYDPQPTDATMKSGPALYGTGANQDTILQPEVLQWMTDNHWMGAHVFWHAFRGCKDGSAAGLLGPLGYTTALCTQYTELVPSDQNCKTSGDGYQFLLFHRHMLQTLKQLWPKHVDDFDGFHDPSDDAKPKFPTTKADLPAVWNTADPKWSADTLAAAAIGDNIDKPENLAKFPDQGTLGHWLQCAAGSAKLASTEPYIGIHFDLHNQWSRGASSDHGLNNGQVNVTNYMFWKLHGWIDKVWEKYRVAKGLTTDPTEMQKYKQDMTESCNQMDYYETILKQAPGSPPMLDCPPDVNESGEFHTKVRPLFESASNHCASCHGPKQSSPYADLTLGGQVSSKCIVQRLKGGSEDGGQFPLVVAGSPEKSYLYLKASGTADAAGCTSSDPNHPCNTAAMPPGGKTFTDAELKILYDWIKGGAAGP